MHKIIVSIFPTYKCNHNCEFCYLRKLHNSKTLDLDVLEQRLNEITEHFEIEKFNTYGGEITLLDEDYLKRLNSILNRYPAKNYITSNFYDIDKLKLFTNCYISTSLNEEREDYEYIRTKLKENIGRFPNNCVLSMITPSIVNKHPYEVLSSYRRLGINWVSFIKYYPNIDTGDLYHISQETYEKTLINLLDTYLTYKETFDFNLAMVPGLRGCLAKTFPIATNDQIIRINPNGNYCSVYYTKDNLEYFKEYDNIDDYMKDAKIESFNYMKKCATCKYYGTCWTEHITNIECDGCKNLLKYMEDKLDKEDLYLHN